MHSVRPSLPSGEVALFLVPAAFFCFRRRFNFRLPSSLLLSLSLSESSEDELKERYARNLSDVFQISSRDVKKPQGVKSNPSNLANTKDIGCMYHQSPPGPDPVCKFQGKFYSTLELDQSKSLKKVT